MSYKILINAADPEECRIAKITETNKLEEFQTETTAREITRGNIYKGVITRVEPSLQAVFVDYGGTRNGFLQRHEIHSDYFQDNPSGKKGIENMLTENQELLVQITKDPIMKKGAMLTTYISLPGRHLVLMPGSKNRGISRKIEDESERTRIKTLMNSLKLSDDFGVIVRTAGDKCTKSIVSKDLKNLMRIWKTIKKNAMTPNAPVLLYKEPNAAIRSIRDYFSEDVTEILVDNETVYQEVKEFINVISPRHKKIVKFYTAPEPIFSKYEVEEQIESVFQGRVSLASGGSLVIDQTEALVAIDVNSGKSTKEGSVESTAYKTNLEAAEIIALQLKLRDLGGLIVIDFIDMKETKHKLEVERVMKNALKNDRARTKVGKISRFGLLEMSRQRINSTIEYGSHIKCSYCRGKGMVPSPESDALNLLRKVRHAASKKNAKKIKGVFPMNVASYLLNRKRKEIVDLEMRLDLEIEIEGDPELIPGESRITKVE
jgi:ribonuclease E